MEALAELALAKQYYERLVGLCDPEHIAAWRPTVEQRSVYISVAEKTLAGLERFERIERRKLLNGAHLQSYVPNSALVFIRDELKPRASCIRAAADYLDPEWQTLRESLEEIANTSMKHELVKHTFEQGLSQIGELLDRNPDWGDDHNFLLDTAYEIFDSKLLIFEPDAWLDRAQDLLPIRTSNRNAILPIQLRLRLEELYRAYVFGCWLSALGLCRSILEYALLDNLHKFNIDASWPPDRNGRRTDKKLSQLITEVAESLPDISESMELLRNAGNDYVHPKKTQVSKEALLQRQPAAKMATTALVYVVESLYRVRKGG